MGRKSQGSYSARISRNKPMTSDSDRPQQARLLVCPSCGSKCRARVGSAKAFRCPRCGTVLRPDDPEEGSYAARAPERVRPMEEPEPDEIENIEVRRKR